MTDICVQPHKDDHPALPALRLCAGCYYGLRGHIKALPRLHADLGGHLSAPAVVTTVSNGPRAAQDGDRDPLVIAETRSPINPAVAELRDQIRHDLVWWTVYVADQRGFKLPDNDLRQIGVWLWRQIDWIAASLPAAEECPPVMKALAGRARAILQPSGAKRIKIGPCREVLEDGPCGGTLYATCRAEDDPRPSAIYCGECDFEAGPESWRRFGRDYLKEAG
ncbi:hypothetical protein [Actinomadura sediminis]|uniref:Uncharacterized protein n=1 Tax=Actinomadura sediminis TaxID=1038904 RepID=A0ABW3EPS2_9ACTN